MLNNIKSSYITKIIFFFIDEIKKLKLNKYNNSLQHVMNININNYIHFKGKYIIKELNSIVKEYRGIDDKLLYEGEYLDGERNGKGKEYDYLNVKIEFEGEYLKGKRKKGKEYYQDGKVKFEGEYLNNKQWIGTRYD